MHGLGTYTFKSSSTYVGEYKDGERDGFGKYTYVDGRITEGQWELGNLIPAFASSNPKIGVKP